MDFKYTFQTWSNTCVGFEKVLWRDASRSFSSLGLDAHARMDVCAAPLTLPSLEECVAVELCRGAWHSSLRMTKTVATYMCSTVEACFQELEQKLRSQGLSTGERPAVAHAPVPTSGSHC